MLQDSKTSFLTEAWGVAWLPDRFHPPRRTRAKSHHRAMTRLVLMEPAERRPDQLEDPGLDGVLVRHDDYIAMGMLRVEPPRHRRHSLGQCLEGLAGEWKAFRVFQVRLQVSREGRGEVPPGMTLPTSHHRPFSEIGVDLHRDSGAGGDLLRSAQRALERRGPDGHDRPRA